MRNKFPRILWFINQCRTINKYRIKVISTLFRLSLYIVHQCRKTNSVVLKLVIELITIRYTLAYTSLDGATVRVPSPTLCSSE